MPEGQEVTAKVQGFGDAIKGAPIVDAPPLAAVEAVTAPAQAEGDAAAAAATGTEIATGKEGVEAASAQPPKNAQVVGVLKGIQAERGRRQSAEARVVDLEAQLAQYTGAAIEQPQAASQQGAPQMSDVERRLVLMSEISARQAHPDYDEKFAAFFKAAEQNPTLYETVMGSDHPGEAAYLAGKTLQLQAKYGTDTDGMIKAIRAETEKELREKIRGEEVAKLQGRIADKGNSPTDITAGRAAGETAAEPVQPLGFAQVLARKQRG